MTSPSALTEPAVGRELLRLLQMGIANRALYPAHHPEVRTPAQKFLATLADTRGRDLDVTLALLEGELHLNGVPLREASVQFDAFLRKLEALQLEVLHFAPATSLDEMETLIDALAQKPDELEQVGGLETFLERHGVRHITCERLVRLPDGRYELLQRYAGGGPHPFDGEMEEGAADPLEAPAHEQDAYAAAVGDAASLFTSVSTGGGLDATLVQAVPQQVVSQCLSEPGAFLNLLHMRTVDNGMFQHAVNTAILSVLLATKLELEEEQLRHIALGALLHDVGELQMPPELCWKAGRLTDAEWEIVRQHPLDGAKLVLALPELQPAVSTIVLEHHVRVDGGGYPGLSGGEGPHIYSRIVAVADAYDALTHPRPYKTDGPDLLPVGTLLKLAGSVYDPTIVKLLLHTVGFFPPGTHVVLSDGRRGVVEAATPGQPFLPRLIVPREEGYEFVDTSRLDEDGAPSVTVVRPEAAAPVPAGRAEQRLEATTPAESGA